MVVARGWGKGSEAQIVGNAVLHEVERAVILVARRLSLDGKQGAFAIGKGRVGKRNEVHRRAKGVLIAKGSRHRKGALRGQKNVHRPAERARNFHRVIARNACVFYRFGVAFGYAFFIFMRFSSYRGLTYSLGFAIIIE